MAKDWASKTETALRKTARTGKASDHGLAIADILRRYKAEVGEGWSRSNAHNVGRLTKSMGSRRAEDLNQLAVMRWLTKESLYDAATSEHILKALKGALSYATSV